jgi:predicted phage baseplate assembly protein
VTELTLSENWVDPDARWLSAIRPLSVRAQPADLTLLPVALPGPLRGSAIELAGLYPGIEAGHMIVVTGTRTDLPAGASIAAGEAAMVAGVTQQTDAAAADTPHTTLRLAAPLTYAYELASVQVCGNVVAADQGTTVTEPVAGAVPVDPHPSFTLSQAPVLADPSPTAAGWVSSLTLTVGGRTWTRVTRLDADTPAESYLTGIDSQGRTTIELNGPLPTGTSSIVATYRAGQGSAGNVRAHQVTQLLSRPLAVAGVDNPLPGSGGSDGDGPGNLRADAPVGLTCLGRLVSAADAADLVRSWAGVGKATAVTGTDGHGEVVVVTVAGVDPVALDPAGALCTDLADALAAAGRPAAPVLVVPAGLYLIVLAARVRRDPADAWPDVSAALQNALFARLGYPCRRLGEDVVLSDITAIAHTVAGVLSFSVTAITLIPTTATASEIQAATANLPPPPADGCLPLPTAAQAGSGPAPAAVAFLSDAMPDTLVLQQEKT